MDQSKKMQFSAQCQKKGKGAFILLPFDPETVWGKRTRYDITGTINEHPVRGKLIQDGENYLIKLGPAWIRDFGKLDTLVEVSLMLEGPQLYNIADDIADALRESEEARQFFEGLPTFNRKNFIRWIESAKREETRSKRIVEMIEMLRQGKKR